PPGPEAGRQPIERVLVELGPRLVRVGHDAIEGDPGRRAVAPDALEPGRAGHRLRRVHAGREGAGPAAERRTAAHLVELAHQAASPRAADRPSRPRTSSASAASALAAADRGLYQ